MKRVFPLSVLLLFLLTYSVYGEEEGILRNYIHISKAEGISNNNIRSIHDDPYSRIWVGTEMGLNIYSSNNLSKPERYSGLNICALFDTGTEMLIGTHGFLEAYNYETGTYTRIKDNEYEITYTFSILKAKDRILIIASGFAYSYENNTVEIINRNVPCLFVRVDKFGTLWGYSEDKIYRFDDDFNVQKEYKLDSTDRSPLIIGCMYPDSKGCVWVGTEKDGLFRYNRVTDTFFREDLEGKYGLTDTGNIGSINEDKFDRLWIGHKSGFSVYDYTNDYMKYYMLENSFNIQLVNIITNIFRTRQQDMVLGTHFTGFFIINELNPSIKFHNLTEFNNQTGGVTSNGITMDNNGYIWGATNCMGISVLDKEGRIIRQMKSINSAISDNILSLEFDKRGNAWAGAASAGLFRIGRDKQIKRYVHHPDKPESLSGRTVHVIRALNEDSILIATNKGIDVYHYQLDKFSNLIASGTQDYAFTNLLLFEDKVYAIHFNTIFRFDRSSGEVKEYSLLDQKNLFVRCGYVDQHGVLWLGTARGNLYQFEDGKLIPYILEHEQTESISNIQGDLSGNLWITAGNNLYCVTPGKEIHRISLQWGMGNNEFNGRSCYTDDQGNIYFGTSNGLIAFDPLQLFGQEIRKPTLFIADLKLFNKVVGPGESSVLQKHINHTDRLVLENNQNYISLVINYIDYSLTRITPHKCMYRLENFDNNWYELNPASNEIIFTRLTTGKYNLIIQLEDSNGEVIQSKTIHIRVKPPVYLSTPAIILYMVILVLSGWWIFRIIQKRRMTRELIEKVKRESDEITRLNAMKLDFFTYISHEFKTPLSILSTLQDEILPPTTDPDGDTAIFKRNVKRLEYLINQLMEFRNMESEHASVTLGKYDMIPFLHGIYNAFAPLYKHKEIEHQFETTVESLPMLFDSNKIEMLIGNLLSNVSKHTRQGGRCYIKITTEDSRLIIDVFNSGECLTEEQQTAIFQPYNKTNTSGAYSNNSGMGLAIVHSIAKLLNIQLSVINVENEGNIFRVEIPILLDDNLAVGTVESHTNIVDRIIDNTIYIEEQSGTLNKEEENRNPFRILIVDNDNDTKKILKKKLQPYFHVLTASNGKEALLLLKSQNADVVVSDIIMPEIDGYELCKAIKGNSKMKHIPVILITSDLSSEAKIKGFQSGADAFLNKPINIQELQLRLDNILRNKNILRAYYSNFNQLTVEPEEVNNADETFMREMTEYIYDHLSDSELSVHQLALHANISRTQLYLNIKRLTGQTPSQFVLNIKMVQARKLLLGTDMTSSEISYKLGYCNPNHFSRQFKEFYGMSPSEFRKINHADVAS